MMTRVLIVDDHPMVAEGIQSILETYDDIHVVGSLKNGQDAVDQLTDLAPDVVLMDLNMPGISGLSATEMMREIDPDIKIVILTMHDSPEYVATARRHGAQGYILKDVPTEEIHAAIATVMTGATYLCSGATAAIRPVNGDTREPLTMREQTVLLELAQGKTNKDVAKSLDISVRTVETHRTNIKRKLQIDSTAGLTRYALEHGVLQGTSS